MIINDLIKDFDSQQRAVIYSSKEEHMKELLDFLNIEDRALNEQASVIFIERGEFRFRSSFYIDNESKTVHNDYGFNKGFDEIYPTDEYPSDVKEALNNYIRTVTFADKQTGNVNMKNDLFGKMIEENKKNLANSAKIELGKSANRTVISKIKPKLPMMARGYADTIVGEIVVGNIVAALLMQFAGDNKKAQILSEAMIAAGAQVALESFDIPGLVQELLDNVTIPEDVE